MPFKRPNSNIYYASVTIGGRQVRRSTGTTVKAEAIRIEKEWRKEVAVPADSWDSLMSHYLSARPTQRAGYAVKALLPFFGGKPVHLIPPAAYTEFVQHRRAEGVTDWTIRRELGVVRTAYRYAVTHLGWQLPEFPSHVIPPRPPSRVRWLTRAEYQDLMKAARKSKAKYLQNFIQLAVNTGMRKSELLELQWSQVDMDSRLIYLNPQQQKGKKYSSVPLNQNAVDALSGLPRETGSVFPVRDLKKAWGTAVKLSGVQDVRIHDLRHTCASWMLQAGASLQEVAEVLRHQDIHTTTIYAHLSPESARAAVNKI